MKKENQLPTNKKAYLILEDGATFEGNAAGLIGSATGEICFNTSMTGYQEIFTDPSYFGQLMVNTNAHIGNYGTLDDENESDTVKISGLVVKNFADLHSRHMSDESLQEYLERNKIVAICNVDTRSLVRHIRSKGAMNAIISSEILDNAKLKKLLKDVPSMEGLELSSKVSTNEAYLFGKEDARRRVAVLDLGVKRNILRNLAARDCFLKVFPAKTGFDEIMKWNPDGFFVSNGPGDPGAMDYAAETTAAAIEKGVPMFGICLGHQILARALEIPTYKMHHGHRGANHPVLNLETNIGEITTQNHGFGVSADALESRKSDLQLTHINLNDDTVEGIKVKGKAAYSVQYHPEASPGPHDSRYLFDNFIDLIDRHK